MNCNQGQEGVRSKLAVGQGIEHVDGRPEIWTTRLGEPTHRTNNMDRDRSKLGRSATMCFTHDGHDNKHTFTTIIQCHRIDVARSEHSRTNNKLN